ncbi:MAG: PA14 domain-containing protein [Planctomycetota bacterium]|nr:PA14 domain-containing protein [Planctomycetota bacterium]MDA1213772.1 PA14 domain-containing protein [Planctomycetota bacterium]
MRFSGIIPFLLVITVASPATCADAINGLIAEYYSDASIGKLVTRQLDPNIDWVWDYGPPLPDIPKDGFSVRWTGWIKAPKAGK